MVILMANMVRWTDLSEKAIKMQQQDYSSLKNLFSHLTQNLSLIVTKVRGDLTELNRLTLSAMVVLDVHNKDVIESFIKENVDNIYEFSWLS